MSEITTRKFLSESEILKLRESLDLAGLKDRVLVRFLMETGCRGVELRGILLRDIDFEKRSVLITGKKRSNSRQVPLSKGLVHELEEMITALNLSDPRAAVFNVSQSGLKLIWNRIRPCKGKGVHALRHTFAVKLYEKSGDIRLVQLCLGHRSIQSTMVYADFVDSQKRIQKVLQGDLYA